MKNRAFIKIDSEGKIICVVISNDPTLVVGDGKNVIDITDFKNKDKIQIEPNYFIIKDNKIIELTTAEKKVVDDTNKRIFEPRENPLIAEVNDLKARLEKLEKFIIFKDKIA